jgi:hypothetical protein
MSVPVLSLGWAVVLLVVVWALLAVATRGRQ